MKITLKMALVLREAGYGLCPSCRGDGVVTEVGAVGPTCCGIVSDSEEEGL